MVKAHPNPGHDIGSKTKKPGIVIACCGTGFARHGPAERAGRGTGSASFVDHALKNRGQDVGRLRFDQLVFVSEENRRFFFVGGRDL